MVRLTAKEPFAFILFVVRVLPRVTHNKLVAESKSLFVVIMVLMANVGRLSSVWNKKMMVPHYARAKGCSDLRSSSHCCAPPSFDVSIIASHTSHKTSSLLPPHPCPSSASGLSYILSDAILATMIVVTAELRATSDKARKSE